MIEKWSGHVKNGKPYWYMEGMSYDFHIIRRKCKKCHHIIDKPYEYSTVELPKKGYSGLKLEGIRLRSISGVSSYSIIEWTEGKNTEIMIVEVRQKTGQDAADIIKITKLGQN